jgi:ferredoxin-NADP reductase
MRASPVTLPNSCLVLDKQTVSSDYFLLILEKPANFIYKAGQCMAVSFPDTIDEQAKIFSIASSPTEDKIILLVKHGASDYKKRLTAIKLGDKLLVSEPMGGFELDYRRPAIMIAGGMGIAPFRSIVKYVIDSEHEQKILLIHLNPSSQSPFANDFTGWQQVYKFLQFKTLNEVTKRLDLQELLRQQQADPGLTSPVYYLAGPPEMVINCRQTLDETGVHSELVREDGQLTAVRLGR